MKKYLLFLLILCVSFTSVTQAATRYVKWDASGSGDGLSWENAYTSLQSALTAAVSGDEIWVAKGIYTPTLTSDRSISFAMKNGVAIYGGFAATESNLNQRAHFGEGEANETILSGDIGTADDNTDNCYHVFYHPDGLAISNTAILNGFTIAGGYYNNAGLVSDVDKRGGGMYNGTGNAPTIQKCVFKDNVSIYGGGIYNYGEGCDTRMENCIFKNNMSNKIDVAGGLGGAIYNTTNADVTIINCQIVNNEAKATGGGIYNNSGSNAAIINTTIANNTADSYGGGIRVASDCSSTLQNCIVWGNVSPNGNQFYTSIDAIINLNYSCYSNSAGDVGGSGGTFAPDEHCLTSNPQFINASGGDFLIPETSPCKDAGFNTYNTLPTDIRGKTRIQFTTIDMGAYEYSPGTIYVNAAAAGLNNGTSWVDAFNSVQSALSYAVSGDEIWVAKGMYKPTNQVGGSTDRYLTFQMEDGVAIYGGFAGTETATTQRTDFGVDGVNETILSGDIGTTGVNTDNCYHVFYHQDLLNLSSSSILNGFTISGGYYNNAGLITDFDKRGGGMHNAAGNTPTIQQCVFKDNVSIYGGGMYNYGVGCNTTIENCIFKNNTANKINEEGGLGGGIYNTTSADVTIINCLISNNIAEATGGGVYNNSGSIATLINTTISNNTANLAGGIRLYSGSDATLENSIVWGNASTSTTSNQFLIEAGCTITLRYSCYSNSSGDINGDLGTPSNCTTDDPDFINAAGGNFLVPGDSPCTNTGNNSYNNLSTDIRGKVRIQDITIDMGAYEYSSGTIYVNAAATGSNNGTSWVDAFNSVQSALSYAINGDEIWVAKGMYKPTTQVGGSTDRYLTFQMEDGVAIYGGFAGTETATTQRTDFGVDGVNETILSGDIGTIGVNTDNCYHVFYHPEGKALSSSSKLDGFTITGAYSNEIDGDEARGGGMHNAAGNAPTIQQCVFKGNSSAHGGGIYNFGTGCNTRVESCIFTENHAINASKGYGGALYNANYADVTIINCLISNNTAVQTGGGIYNNSTNASSASNATLINTTIANNTATNYAGGIRVADNCTVSLQNCIVWGNVSSNNSNQFLIGVECTVNLNYSCYSNSDGDVSGSLGTPSNCITDNPLFINADDNDFRILGDSPCTNTGLNDYNALPTDVRGQTRIQNTTIDMGAYEWTSGMDPISLTNTWTGTVSSEWDNSENWNPGEIPSSNTNAIIPLTTNKPVVSQAPDSPAICDDLTIESGTILTINPGTALTVNGTFINNAGNAGLVIKSTAEGTGSLIHSTENVPGTVERFIGTAVWTDWEDGWHFVSSPVADFPIEGNFTVDPAADYDFYAWSESDNLWINYKDGTDPTFAEANGSTTFELGHGYMAAYASESTKAFTGPMNVADVSVSGLTITGTIANGNGWNLIGNPFTSALTWYTDWTTSNIGGVANIWNEAGKSYTPISAGGIIPAGNGFMVQVSEGTTGSLTIPAANRTHSAQNWYKNSEYPVIKLLAHNLDYPSFQESQVRFNPNSTTGFDKAYDGNFLAGYAPLFYSVMAGENLMVNSLPEFSEETVIPFHFIKNEGANFTIEVSGLESLLPSASIYLKDNKLGKNYNLSENPVYTFTATDGDDPARFELYFGPVGINPLSVLPTATAWVYKGILTVKNGEGISRVGIFNIQGQQLQHFQLQGNETQHLQLNLPAGVYIARMVNDGKMQAIKMIIQ